MRICIICHNPSLSINYSRKLNVCYCINCSSLVEDYEKKMLKVPLNEIKDFVQKFKNDILFYFCEFCYEKSYSLFKLTFRCPGVELPFYRNFCNKCYKTSLNSMFNLENVRLKLKYCINRKEFDELSNLESYIIIELMVKFGIYIS